STDPPWTTVTVDLCEALDYALGTVYLTFYWDTWCIDPVTGEESVCAPLGITEKKPLSWHIDDVSISQTGASPSTLLSLDHEPEPSEDGTLLLVSRGVDHDLLSDTSSHPHTIEAGSPHPLATYIPYAVKNGTNLLALLPGGSAGNWFGELGLASETQTAGQEASTVDAGAAPMVMPNGLPEEDADYLTASMGYDTGATTGPTGAGPDDPLTTAQSYSGVATLLSGQPFAGSGMVTGLAYELDTLASNDEDLHDDLVENAYASSIFRDPTFDLQFYNEETASLQDSQLPDHIQEVATARAVILVTLTDDDLYSVPVELTLYLWNQCIDDPGTSEPEC
ncbi:MAG: hypothetical protein R3185_08310, partial [Candidatus Thermoplasmatota archaeon]|nr:hypothetical protein [Candidatus Thermoplasmatota archaeon]